MLKLILFALFLSTHPLLGNNKLYDQSKNVNREIVKAEITLDSESNALVAQLDPDDLWLFTYDQIQKAWLDGLKPLRLGDIPDNSEREINRFWDLIYSFFGAQATYDDSDKLFETKLFYDVVSGNENREKLSSTKLQELKEWCLKKTTEAEKSITRTKINMGASFTLGAASTVMATYLFWFAYRSDSFRHRAIPSIIGGLLLNTGVIHNLYTLIECRQHIQDQHLSQQHFANALHALEKLLAEFTPRPTRELRF